MRQDQADPPTGQTRHALRLLVGFLACLSLVFGVACFGALVSWMIRMVMVGGGVPQALRMAWSLGWEAVAFVGLSVALGTLFLAAGFAVVFRK